jgi:ribonuclease Y
MTTNQIILILVGAGAFAFGYLIRLLIGFISKHSIENRAKESLQNAEKNAEVIQKDAEIKAKDTMFKKREEFERETKEKRDEIRELEKRINKKEDNLDGKVEILERKGNELKQKESKLQQKDQELNRKLSKVNTNLEQQKKELHRISSLSQEDARKILLERIEKDVEEEASELIKNHVERAKNSADKEAHKIIAYAIEKCASDFVSNNVITSVELPDDDMKGRVIGRDGRNIRAFEKATGVDLIVDDTPELVVISSFNGVRREVARLALERLISDGRIHPGRIEDIVNKTRKEVIQEIRDTGDQVLEEVGIHKVHPKLVEYLGALKYRTSYGQNVLQHSVEVSFLAGTMAAELDLDEMTARRAGLFHDIGKSVDQEKEGTHLEIGGKIARRYNEKDSIVNAIEAHHECDVEVNSIYTVLIKAADALSASRPGARRDTLERYIQRMEKLEEVANEFEGVVKAYALQAGREVRVMVQANEVTDNSCQKLCRDIANKIENELTYPGEIKVTLIRETRTIEYAR